MSETIKEVLTGASTDAAVTFAAGLATSLEVKHLGKIPFIFNPLTNEVKALEHLLDSPVRQKTVQDFKTLDSFVDYVNRFKTPATSLYAEGSKIIARIDHREAAPRLVESTATAREIANLTGESLTWGDHIAILHLNQSEGLTRWIQHNGKPLDQEGFAELLESRNEDISAPAGAEILEIVRELHITRNSSVKRQTRSNGKLSVEFNENTEARGGASNIELPTRIELKLQPFRGQAVTLELALLIRVRIRDTQPVFIYEIQNLQERLDEVLSEIVTTIGEKVERPIYV